jgi:predicted Kef-type K+ transport protein
MFNKKWQSVLALAVSYPSTILFVAWGLNILQEEGVISQKLGHIALVVIIINSLFMIVYYAYRNKKN